MDFIDIIVTPFYVLFLFIIAYLYKSKHKNIYIVNRHFLKAYILRILGGIAFGCIYFFYYGGGDTFNYHTDSLVLSNAIRNDFFAGMDILFSNEFYKHPIAYNYQNALYFEKDVASMAVVRIAGVLNLITFDSFLSTTILFSLMGFWGSWKLFLTLCKMFPSISRELAIGCLYLPSIIFWASGIMKDTICTVALCILFSNIIDFFIFKKRSITIALMSVFCFYILITVKIYIAMCFVPTISVFLFSTYSQNIKNESLRRFIKPVFYLIALAISYFGVNYISEDDDRYRLDKIEETARATSDYIGRISQNIGGSYYTLGELDFSLSNIPNLIVKSFVVTFYRPFIWELKAPLMLFSALEGLYFIYLTYLLLLDLIKVKKFKNFLTPFTSFCFLFSLTFSFAVGISTNNFGTLARYKALMLPFFVCGVYVTIKHINKKID